MSGEYCVNAKEWEEFCKNVGGETKASEHIKAAHGDEAKKLCVYDGRACKQCNGNMTSEDHRYCSDKCREEVRGMA